MCCRRAGFNEMAVKALAAVCWRRRWDGYHSVAPHSSKLQGVLHCCAHRCAGACCGRLPGGRPSGSARGPGELARAASVAMAAELVQGCSSVAEENQHERPASAV